MTGAELAAIRKAAGLSQTELAQRAGIGRHAVSYWECKAKLDRRSWAVVQIGKVMALPDEPRIERPRTVWADTLARMDADIDQRFAEAKKREAARATKRRVRCKAKTRKDTPCRMLSEPGKRRCKFHGGMSTGARTPEGKERIREAQRRRWAKWRAEQGIETGQNRPGRL